MFQIIEAIDAHLQGAPPKLVSFEVETGLFGLVKPKAGGGDMEWALPPLELPALMGLARGLVAGKPTAITSPTGQRDLAIGFLVALFKIGELSGEAEAREAHVAELEAKASPTVATVRFRDGEAADVPA